jgi:hypothetical protein
MLRAANPGEGQTGELNEGTVGVGSSSHLNIEMFQSAATSIRLKPVHAR